MCTCAWVCLSVFLSVGETCMSLYVCEGQRTTLGASNHLLPCLRQGLLFTTAYPRLAHQWASGSSVAISHLTVGTLGWQRSAITFIIHGFWRPRPESPLTWSMPSESFAHWAISSAWQLLVYHKRPLLLCTHQEQRKMQMQMKRSYCGRAGDESRTSSQLPACRLAIC